MAKTTRSIKSARKSNSSNKAPGRVVIDRKLIAEYARASAAVLREAARELDDLAEAKRVAPDAMAFKMHGIFARNVGSTLVGAQDIRDAISRAN